MKMKEHKVIVADTTILVNFLKINRLDLLKQHSYEFKITDHVVEEITDSYKNQRDLLIQSLNEGIFTQESLTSIKEIKLFAHLESRRVLGLGECSAIAYAIYNNYALAIDDKVAIKNAKSIADELNANLKIFTTQDIMVSLIKKGVLDTTEADNIKSIWEVKHRFKLKIDSFRSPTK